jgi:hypothetical protein
LSPGDDATALRLGHAGILDSGWAPVKLVEQRLAEHQRNSESAVPLDDMKSRLRGRFTP